MTAQLATIQPQQQTAIASRNDVSTQALVFDPQTIQSMMQMAEMMSKASVTVPKHLAGKPADCLAVIMQAAQFQMNPFAVAQKTHLVNGQLGYEAQLVNAVVQNSGAINGRFHYEYRGEGANIECRVGAVLSGESDITWGGWLSAASVATKSSPLWKTNPRQQLGYLQVKNWARQYTPGAILGVYSADELEPHEERAMGQAAIVEPDQTPSSSSTRTESVKAKLKRPSAKRLDAIKAEIKSRNPEPEEAPAEALDAVLSAIAAADTQHALDAIADRAGKLEGDDKTAARKAWTERKRELETPPVAPEPEPTGKLTAEVIITSISKSTSESEIDWWLDAALDADITDTDRANIQNRADTRRADLTTGSSDE